MAASRTIFQAREKIRVMQDIMHQVGRIPAANMKSLADAASIQYSTLKSAVQGGRFSVYIECSLEKFCGFDRECNSWIDESIPESKRREINPADYRGMDTAENFRRNLLSRWSSSKVSFGAMQRRYSAIDPHMARHELTDCGQSTPEHSEMPFLLASYFEPFFHKSGITFGFRKAKLSLEVDCSNGAYATQRLGHPEAVIIRNASISADALSRQIEWNLECQGEEASILNGEYATTQTPLVTIANHIDGTSLTSRIEVNLYDRKALVADAAPAQPANKAALIEQIFSLQLPHAAARNGWITLSEQECVVARYGQ